MTTGDPGKIVKTVRTVCGSRKSGFRNCNFAILIICTVIVINKGSERVSEVTARFTLDAMPGKQMAIDADLNTGAITDVQAREKRKIQEESAFFRLNGWCQQVC